jgi:hypothetical protein
MTTNNEENSGNCEWLVIENDWMMNGNWCCWCSQTRGWGMYAKRKYMTT